MISPMTETLVVRTELPPHRFGSDIKRVILILAAWLGGHDEGLLIE